MATNKTTTVILDREDFRTKEDGYHLCMFDGLVEKLGLPKNTSSMDVTIKVNDFDKDGD